MTQPRPRLVVIGAGGHAKVIIDMLQDSGEYELAGCLSHDANERDLLGVPRLGDDDALGSVFASGIRHAFIAIGNNRVRADRLRHARAAGFTIVNAISRHAVISRLATLGAGVAVMPGAVINVGTVIGDGAIVNTGATVDHDCRIGECVHIAPGTHLAGTVTVGDGAFLGVGTSVIPKQRIGAWTMVGAGAVIVRDVPDGVTVVGVPARTRTPEDRS